MKFFATFLVTVTLFLLFGAGFAGCETRLEVFQENVLHHIDRFLGEAAVPRAMVGAMTKRALLNAAERPGPVAWTERRERRY